MGTSGLMGVGRADSRPTARMSGTGNGVKNVSVRDLIRDGFQKIQILFSGRCDDDCWCIVRDLD